jgi:basic amino acid/polyamine antiporter, APA family
MSSTTGTRPALQPPGGQASPGPPAGQEQGATLGLVSATGLVMGSIIGVGVFTMPAVLAAAGTSSLVVMAVVAAGAMLLAVLFGQLTRRVPAAVNLAGLRHMARFQNVTVVLKYVPLLFVGVVGWFFVRSANFGPFNASGGSLYSCIGIAASVSLFLFIGVEVAAITAKRVRNPRKNVGRASILGTAASAIVYLLVTAVVIGLVPHHALVGNGAPFVTALDTMFPHGTWAGKAIAAVAVVSGIGCLNGWVLVSSEVARAPADDGLFPRPFGWTDRHGSAWFGIVLAALLPSLLLLWRYASSSGLTVYTYLVDLTVVAVALPYLFSACAQLTYLVSKRRPVQGWLLARDLSIAGASALFSLWVTFASGYQAVVVVLAGIVLYAFLTARRERSGQIPEPVDNPPDDPVGPAPADTQPEPAAGKGEM